MCSLLGGRRASWLLDSLCSFVGSDALGRPVPLPLRVIPGAALYPKFLYHNCFVFSALLLHFSLFPSETITTLAENMSYCLFVLTSV